MIDFNTEPYNDDFDENNKFYRILFRPSFAVQARELTQMQTILQNQIKRHGDHVFKEGAMVIPGQASVDTKISYIRLKPIYAGAVIETFVNNLEGLVIKNAAGLTAKVIKVVNASGSEAATLYVRYTNSGDDNVTKTFANNEILTPEDTTLASYTVQAFDSDAVGTGSIATIQRGVYYTGGYFVLCDEQTIVLDKYSNNPTYRIGLNVTESLVTPEDPGYEMLLDNAQNSYNYAAPGAHRYMIDLTLSKLPLSSTNDTNFIELMQVSNGETLRQVRSTDYSVLEKTMARRTFDESGNYTVTPFKLEVREHRSNDRGPWKNATAYLIGDIVTNNGYSYVAKISGTSLGTGSGPLHTSGTQYEDIGSSGGVQWEQTNSPSFNRGVFKAEGKVVSVTVTNGGSGYTTSPAVSFSGGNGTGALATAIVSDGKVVAIEMNESGSGYTGTPTVSITGGGGSGATATAYADYGIESKLAIAMEAGKAYVQGYEIEKISTEYVSIDKARTFEQTSDSYIQSPVGNYVFVTNLNSLPPFDTFDTLTIYDRLTNSAGRGTAVGSAVGTARVRGIEWDSGTIGTTSAVYKLYLFDVKMNNGKNFSENAKSFFFNRSSNAKLSFSADVNPILTDISGSVTTYTTYPTKGASTTLTGSNTSFQTELAVGDYIQVGTFNLRVTAINSQNSITVDTSVTLDGAPIKLITTRVEEPQSTSLVYPLPDYAIKSATNANGENKTVYYTMQYVTGSTGSASGSPSVCTMTINTTSGVFASEQENDNYIVMYNDGSAGGTVVKPLSISAGGGTSITFTLDGAYASKDFTIMATVKKSGIGRKSKTVASATTQFNTLATATSSTLNLTHADVFRIISVKMKTGTFGSEGSTYSIDITDRYDFDNGQRETHYDIGKLKLKPSYNPPSASIEVTYEYFDHGTGDYFTVDSYPANVQYKDIPSFNGVSLRDSIDFRPRINDAGTGFTGSGSSYSASIKRGQDLTADYSYYLPRKDKISIDFNGNYTQIAGVPSLTPTEPLDPQLGMVLYRLTLEPYTFAADTQSVLVDTVDNKRYTMRDIGKLERRIENLEYYTSLSLLEQETQAMKIQDSTGLDRFKRGFIVDNFTTQEVGDATSPDFLCSIDSDTGTLRPFYTMGNVAVLEKNTDNTSRNNANYKLYGDVITLPLDENSPHVILAQQQYASRLENINPFAIFTFLGNISINPSSDDWFEVQRRPDIIRNVEGNYTALRIISEKAGVLGTVWNAWQTSWTGTPTVVGSRTDVFRGPGWRVITSQILATNVGQARTGINTSLVAKIDNQVVDDRVVSTAVIPYMRSRYLLVKVRGLKPSTRFYPYFDTMFVDYWATPASYLEYTLPSSTAVDFDDKTNAGGNSSYAARRIDFTKNSLYGDNTGARTCLDVGDVITGSTSGITAVVIGKDYNPDTGVRRLHIVNIKRSSGTTPVDGDYWASGASTVTSAGATFTIGETITGDLSLATATVVSATGNKQHVQEPLVSNFNGDLNFLFWIPDYTKAGYAHSEAAGSFNGYQFRCGTREFKLVDSATYDGVYTSSARTTYSATGTLQTKQATVNAVRNAELVQEVVRDNRVIVETSERVVSDTGWYDPLAQTFLVQSPGGAFLSKVDIFFASKDTKMPVTLEIREVVNGYPGKRILPFSKVSLKPEDVKLSTNTVPLVNFDGTTVNTPSYDTPTTFTFPSPVFVQDNQEYAIVLSSDSNNYKVWISQMGDKIPGSSRTISEQPYAGVFFKSQNASTWTADQTQDLKFNVWRAKFKTDVVGTVQFVNNELGYVAIEKDPFQTASGSSKIRVWHANHGLYAGSKVTLARIDSNLITVADPLATGTISASTSSTTVTGTGTQFTTEIGSGTTGSGTVLYKSDGTYIGVVASVASNTSLTLTSNAAVAVTSGSSFKFLASLNGIPVTEVFKTHNSISDVDSDSYCVTVSTNATSTGYTGGDIVRATYNLNYDAVQPSLQVQNFSETKLEVSMKTTSGKSIDGGETPYVAGNFVPCQINETNYFYNPQVIASKDNSNTNTFTLNAQISSSNNALSPIIDSQRTSVITVSNKLNAPTETNTNVSSLDNVTLFSGATGAFNFAGKVASVPVTAGGSGYTGATVSFSAPSISGGVTATGVVKIVNGSISSVEITNPGSGYTTPPTATLSGTGGSGATLGTVVLDIKDIVSSVTAVKNLMLPISVGKYITVSGSTTTANDGTYLVTGNVTNGSLQIVTVTRATNLTSEAAATGTTVVLRNLFVDEISPVGSSTISKYVSKTVTLTDKADFLRIRFAANIPTEANVLVYYKASPNGASLDMQSINWTLVSPDKTLVKVENGDATFYDVDYTVSNMIPYDAVTVKLVMQSTNTSAVPQIKDLRIISCV